MDGSDGSDRSDKSDKSDKSDQEEGCFVHGDHDLIRPHGGYRKLRSFQCARQVYDATVVFCNRFVDKRSRTHDQMVQAARSGVQNIAEGSMASATSKMAGSRNGCTANGRTGGRDRDRPSARSPRALRSRRR